MSRKADSNPLTRRRILQGAAVGGGAVGAVGLYRLSADPASAQDNQDSVTAAFCGDFSPGPQVQQCIDCVEAECDEVNSLTPLFTGLSGQCFSPDSIPDGADYVTLKGGTNCYLAPVDGATEFCMPDGAPDVSNATFYRCGGEPTPSIVDVTVTCDSITVTTANIADDTILTVTVTFLDADSQESTETIDAIVMDNSATFDLPGDLNPTAIEITMNGTELEAQAVVASDAPCTDDPQPPDPDDPRLDDLSITCEAITIFTVDIPEGDTLEVTVTVAGGLVESVSVPVDAEGEAIVGLPGDLDPSHLTIAYDSETLFDGNVQAVGAPCGAPDPDPPTPKEKKYQKRKKADED